MIRNEFKAVSFIICILITNLNCLPQRDGRILSLENLLKTRYVNSSPFNFNSFPFFIPLWRTPSAAVVPSSPIVTSTTINIQENIKPTESNEPIITNEEITNGFDESLVFPNRNGNENQFNYSCPPCLCGIANSMDRIVGGWATEINEYPWMVALLQAGKFFCGGTLISDRYVLTAAHCVRSSKRHKDLSVLFSEHNRAMLNETITESRIISKVILHPKYNSKGVINHDNDIALLKLKSKIEFKTTISPVCLPKQGNKYTSQLGTVVGWGRITENGKVSSELMAAQVPIMSNTMCSEFPDIKPKLTNNMVCAGYIEGGKDSCQGDSGGALLVEDYDARYLIAGVVSWGNGCARPNNPGVYSRVTQYIDWIDQNTKDGCFCY